MTRLARLALSLFALLALLLARPATADASTRGALDVCADLLALAEFHPVASTPVSPGCAQRAPSSARASTAKGETDGAQRALAREHRRVGASNDGLHRLKHAEGEWRYGPGKRNRYQLDLQYDAIHNLQRKTQSHTVHNHGNSAGVTQKKTTYDWQYTYAGTPHAPTQIGEKAFLYDPSGNQIAADDLTSGQIRTAKWDEENRLQEIADNGKTTRFKYDAAGQRIIKRGAQGETAYVNQFWTVRNRTVATKHIFVGETRVTSKLVPGDANIEPPSGDPYANVLGKWWIHRSVQGFIHSKNTQKNPHYAGNVMPDQLPEDGFVYFYHPDHLGSTSYVTDAAGDLYEHTGYFPHGETWIDQANSSEALPYLFTGKELDQETGLYYFGARYYDPQTALWQSADPALAEFLTDGRIGHPPRLSLYAYTWHNPLRLRDPDGRDPGCGDACFQSVALMDGAITLEQATRSELMVGLGVVVGAATVVALEVAAASPVAAMEAANIAVEASGGTGVAVARTVGVGVALKAADKLADAGVADDAVRAVRGVADDVAGQVGAMFGGGERATGRGANHLKPDPRAQGAHSTWKTNSEGRVSGHAEWRANPRNPTGFDQAKRVDTQYGSRHTHRNKVTGVDIPTPHAHDPAAPGGVRTAVPDELPK